LCTVLFFFSNDSTFLGFFLSASRQYLLHGGPRELMPGHQLQLYDCKYMYTFISFFDGQQLLLLHPDYQSYTVIIIFSAVRGWIEEKTGISCTKIRPVVSTNAPGQILYVNDGFHNMYFTLFSDMFARSTLTLVARPGWPYSTWTGGTLRKTACPGSYLPFLSFL
jgi:hypothetical protein